MFLCWCSRHPFRLLQHKGVLFSPWPPGQVLSIQGLPNWAQFETQFGLMLICFALKGDIYSRCQATSTVWFPQKQAKWEFVCFCQILITHYEKAFSSSDPKSRCVMCMRSRGNIPLPFTFAALKGPQASFQTSSHGSKRSCWHYIYCLMLLILHRVHVLITAR